MKTQSHFSHGCATLVPYSSVHDVQTVKWLNDPAVAEEFGISHSVTLEGHRIWLAAQSGLHVWAILDRGGKHCGNVLLHLSPRHSSGYFQMYVGEIADRGKGLGTSALWCLLKHGFDALGLHRIWMHLLPSNAIAARMYKKFGFVGEGHERESLLKNGRFYDQLRLSLLRHEWDNQKISVEHGPP